MAGTLAQASPTLQNRYTNVARSPHTRFDQGMIRDVASWELPEGAAYDVVDMLCDYVGKVRKRGGTTSPAAGNSSAVVENILGYASNSPDGITGLFGSVGKGPGQIYTIDPAGAGATSLGATATNTTFAGRPFQHGNLMVFPFQILGYTSSDTNALFFAGGATTSALTGTAATVTGGDNRVTGVVGITFTAGMLGGIVDIDGGSNRYLGRITEVTSTSAVRVEPTPTVGFTASAMAVQKIFSPGGASAQPSAVGRFGVSYQNRIVMGYTISTASSQAASWAKGYDRKPNRIIWSQLPTEPIPLGGLTGDGQAELFPLAFAGNNAAPYYNFLDFPGLGPSGITAVAVAGEGNLIVFGARQTYRVTGTLDTETTQSPAFDFTEGLVSANVGCIAQRSIQYTQSGLVFAAYDNIYAFDGSAMRPLLTGRNTIYYQDRLRAGDRPVGSAYSLNRNHYVLSMNGSDTSAIVINLSTYACVRFTNVQLFDSTPDPTDATKLWGVRWWDTTGAAPTMTKGQLIAIDPIWLPAQANASDADGTAVLFDFQSASYLDGMLSTNKIPTDVQVSYDLRGTGSPTATLKVDTKLNTADASYATVTISLANTGSVALTQGFPTGTLVAEGEAVEFRLTGNAACAKFELLGLDVGTQHRPEGFST